MNDAGNDFIYTRRIQQAYRRLRRLAPFPDSSLSLRGRKKQPDDLLMHALDISYLGKNCI